MERVPHETVPAIRLPPLAAYVQVPGQYIEPRSHASATVPFMAIWPLVVLGAQTRRFQQARSPTGHQADPLHPASPAGGWLHGAAHPPARPPGAWLQGAATPS